MSSIPEWRPVSHPMRATSVAILGLLAVCGTGCAVPPPDEELCAMLQEASTWRTATYDQHDLQHVAGSIPERLGHRMPNGEIDFGTLAGIQVASSSYFWSLREYGGLSFRRATAADWRAFIMRSEIDGSDNDARVGALMNDRIVQLAALVSAKELGPSAHIHLVEEYFDACEPR